MTSRIVLPLTTAMLAYQAVIAFTLNVSMGLNSSSITRSVVITLLFGAMVAALWLRPRIGRWPVAAFFAVKVWVYAGGVLSPDAGSGSAISAAMAALCAGLIYALFRTELSLGVKDAVLSPRA